MLVATPLSPDPAHAQRDSSAENADGDDAEAREQALALFEESLEHYRQGRFRKAADLLLRARELRREAVLLYNLARAYEGLGDLDNALDAYARYLEEAPDTEDRGAIERRIETLQEQIDERERLARERRERERDERAEAAGAQGDRAARPPPSDDGVSAWPWVLAGSGAAVLAGGTALGLLSRSRRQDAVDDPVHRSARQSERQAERFALGANISFAVGGALLAAGATWLSVELVRGDEPESARVTLLPGPMSLTARVRWGGGASAQ